MQSITRVLGFLKQAWHMDMTNKNLLKPSIMSIAYHTCLNLWALDIEQARASGQFGEIRAALPISAVL
jgi:hypothetical protein